jgi:hypothetical protein
MPPGAGISDDKARQRMLTLAKEFETIGDRALKFEDSEAN